MRKAVYPGNLGLTEMYQFMTTAPLPLVVQFNTLIKRNKTKEAVRMLEEYFGIKFHTSIYGKGRTQLMPSHKDPRKRRWMHVVLQKSKSTKKGFSDNIEKDTIANENFRKVLYTGEHTQLVVMSLNPGEDIGMEVHKNIDQFFRIEAGEGLAVVNGHKYKISNGSSVVVPAGSEHNFINTGKAKLKLYSLYSPPNHKDKTIHKTKLDANEDDEHFDGKTTER